MRWRWALLGMVIMAAPGFAAGVLLGGPAPARAWPISPPEPPSLLLEPPPRWDEPARASLSMLRRISVTQARLSDAAIAACQASAGRAGASRRNARFRRCGTAPLARTDGFATANSRMLATLVSNADATDACRERVLTLSGTTTSLSYSARTTLREGLAAPWSQLVEMLGSVRALAGQVLRLARAPGWGAACAARPPAPGPAA